MRTKKLINTRKKFRRTLRKDVTNSQKEDGKDDSIESQLTSTQQSIEKAKLSVKSLAEQFSSSLTSTLSKSNFNGWSKLDMKDYIVGMNGGNSTQTNNKRKTARNKAARFSIQTINSSANNQDSYKFSIHKEMSGYIEEYRNEKMIGWKKIVQKHPISHPTSLQTIGYNNNDSLK